MFYKCTSLNKCPSILPATTLKDYCYESMLYDCSGLTTTPELPATTLANYCYSNMFYGCTNLTTAPELPATMLAEGCYKEMFEKCPNINSVTCLATDISATDCTLEWLNGVAASGTFTKAASMEDWPEGVNGIPTGWNIVNAT
jgi:hypothetical protein